MEYIEVFPLPPACQTCTEAECYNCDFAGLRWVLSPRDQLILSKKGKQQAIRRLQREIAEIDRKLAEDAEE